MERRDAIKIIQNHWNYFIAIEQDLSRLSRFIEFDESNYSAFSLEMARILMTSSAEVDVIMKMYCKELSSTSTTLPPSSIGGYKEVIKTEYPDFFMSWIKLPKYGFDSITPWEGWRDNDTPDWWTANNKIKHHRAEYFSKANLKNTLYSVAGLFALLSNFKRILEEKHGISFVEVEVPTLFKFMGSCDP